MYALMKVGVDLCAPKKFGRTYMPSFFFRDLCALLLETNGKETLTCGIEQEKRPNYPYEWKGHSYPYPLLVTGAPPGPQSPATSPSGGQATRGARG